MFHVDNDFRISLLLCTFNMKNFFANFSLIALNLAVYRNEYNSTTKNHASTAFLQEMSSRQPYFYCALKNRLESPLVYFTSINGKNCPHLQASCACDFKELSK